MQQGRGGMGSHKHGVSGYATKSPRFRYLLKLEAERNLRKNRSRILDPKKSVKELFDKK